MTTHVGQEELWSWVDRGAPELEDFLARHPERVAEVEALRGTVRGLASLRAAPPVPERIGPYRVIRLLGSGGMGIVYEAEQSAPRRHVAIKVIRGSSLADERAMQLFEREVAALGRLRHPSIVAIHEAGRTADGLSYFAMELVNGRPLVEHARAKRLSLRERLELFQRVCTAVEHAHAHGVVHRDLKPDNVLVEDDGSPRILDFGLARLAESELSLTLASTDAGHVLGTLPYMSPEQAQGRTDEVGARSDVYSLGVVLYELCADRRPFDVAGLSYLEALRIIVAKAPRRPGSVAKVPAELDAIVLRALEKDPGRRYATAGELAAEVARFLAGVPVLARRPSWLYRARKLVARHKVAAALLAVSLFGGWQWLMRTDYLDPLVADGYPEVAPFSDVRWSGARAEVLVDDTWYELVAIDGVRVGTIVEFCKQTTDESPFWWKKRFEQDLWQVIWRMGRFPGLMVELTLRADDGAELEEDRMWSFSRRTALCRATTVRRARMPFSDVRFQEERMDVEVDGTLYALVSVDGITVEEIERLCRALQSDWQALFLQEFANVMAELGSEPGETVDIVVRSLESGEERALGPIASTHEKFAAVRALMWKSPFEDVQWIEGRLRARIRGVWYEVLALEGFGVDEVLRRAELLDPGSGRRLFAISPLRPLRALGADPGDVIRVSVRDPANGETLEIAAPARIPEWRFLILP